MADKTPSIEVNENNDPNFGKPIEVLKREADLESAKEKPSEGRWGRIMGKKTPETVEEGFLQDIVDHPDDDVPRLIYADWLQDQGGQENQDRANFIRLQINEPGTHARPNYGEIKTYNKFFYEWKKRYPNVGTPYFSRGFMNFIIVVDQNVPEFNDESKDVFSENPLLDRLELLMISHENLRELLINPSLTRIEDITFQESNIGVPELELILNCKYLKNLKQLDLHGSNIGNHGLRLLFESPIIENITYLNLSGINTSGAAFLGSILLHIGKLKNLKKLRLVGIDIDEDVQRQLEHFLPDTKIIF